MSTVLGDVARVVDCEHRTAPRAAVAEAYGFSVGTSAVRGGRISLESAKPVTQDTWRSWTRRAEPQPGDLIFSREAPMGEVAEVPSNVPVCLGQRTVLLQLRLDLIDPSYLKYSLMAPPVQRWIISNSAGSTVPHLNVADVRRIPIGRLPSLDQQRDIVEVLEGHLSRLDAAQQELFKAKVKAKAWAAAVADEALYGRGHPLRPVGDLLREGLRNGHSAPASQAGYDGLRTLTLTAVTRGEFSDRYTKLTSADPGRVADLWLKYGDILVQRSNTPDLVGSAALYSGPDDWAIFPDLMIRLRCDLDQVSPQYLIAALRAERTHRLLRSKAKGLAGSMPKIDQAAIASLHVPVPMSDVERERVTAEVMNAETTRLRLDVEMDIAVRRGLRLSQALFSAAFSGRLTSRGHLDELKEMADV